MSHYGCRREILQIVSGTTIANNKDTKYVDHCACHNTPGQQFHLCEWTQFKQYTSSKIPFDWKPNTTPSVLSRAALFSVKHNQYFMHKCYSEISHMKHAIASIRDLFSDISDRFSRCESLSHMTYDYTLRGSMSDNCKCFAPNEFDAVLTIRDLNGLNISKHVIEPSYNSKWSAFCTSDGHLIVGRAAQEFYTAFAFECQRLNRKNQAKAKTGIVGIVFQYMSKISLIKLRWQGNVFKHLNVSVDVVLAFPLQQDCQGQ